MRFVDSDISERLAVKPTRLATKGAFDDVTTLAAQVAALLLGLGENGFAHGGKVIRSDIPILFLG